MRQKLSILIIALSTFMGAKAANFQVDGLYYKITSNSEPYTVEVTCQNYLSLDNYSRMTTATIPETVTYNEQAYSVTSIGAWAFAYCSGLTSVTIPNSVTSIGKSAFYYCSGLTSVTIPNSVTSIGDWAFDNVKHIDYNGNATGSPWGAISMNGTIDGDFVYSDADKKNLIAYIGAGGEITIPNSVTSIGWSAFEYCSGLKSVTIPNSVTSIGYMAFSGCSGLTSVTIPNSVTSIGKYAFSECIGLKSVTFAENSQLTSIGDDAFYKCSGLTSVNIPNSVTSIGDDAFYNVKYIDYNGNATGSPWGAISINGTTDGDFVYSDADKKNLIAYIGAGGDITIPNSATSIGDKAFYECSGLTSVTIPNSVTSIGDYAFSGCTIATIYCQATERPSDWSFEWDYNCGTVVWGYVGIAEKVASNVKIYARHNTIVVENAEAEISVFDATGRCVAKRKATSDHIEVAMPRQGIYIVKVGAEAAKVVVGCL